MERKAEIFDKFQYLYETTGFSDHQVHCVIRFEGGIQAELLQRAAQLLLKAVPILSGVYRAREGKSCWEDAASPDIKGLFTVTDKQDEFQRFSVSKTEEATGPQIRFCLLQSKNSALSIVINHMVCDAAGFKQCVYLFSEIYSRLQKNPNYVPDFVIDGDRGFKGVFFKLSFFDRVKLFFRGSKDNNQKSAWEFPMSKAGDPSPFIVSHEISPEVFGNIRACCRLNDVTVNDILLAGYFRALTEILNLRGRQFAVPIMIDMRRYLNDKSFLALTNLSSTTIVKITVDEDESFGATLGKVSAVMREKKAGNMGLNTFLKLDAGFEIPFLNVYGILRKSLRNPKISMTNIGVLDSSKLLFENSEVKNAAMFASIKYRPHFQMSATSFNDKITLGVGLYGTPEDRANIENFFDFMDSELEKVREVSVI
ncbi:MAG: hypothetical protein EOM51_07680 [Clostridia bacterium]|nr:hypothetical protein [Clostridia bacterium]